MGKAKYSLLLAEDGGIIDDVIVYRLGEDDFLIISNAGNRDAVREALQARTAGRGVAVEDVSDSYALIAVQGPNAEAILAATPGIEDVSIPWAEQKYYAWASADLQRQAAAAGPHRLHRRGRVRAARRRRRCHGALGCGHRRRRRRTVWSPPGSPRATPCASRRACRCTGTS